METKKKEVKTAIVTGASSGIGLGIAKALLECGYRVVAASRNMTKSGVLQASEQAILLDGDVGDKRFGERLTETAVAKTDRLDLLVNNAGIFVPGDFHDYSEEKYRSIMATNADGFFYVTQPAVRQMRKQGHGHVVSISTTLAVQPVKGLNAFGTYFTKGGINAATKSLAIEYAERGIRFNAIGAGIIDTPMHKPEHHEALKRFHPIQRLGTIQEIVDAVLYLEKAEFVTGEALNVDGGAHAGKW
jgi:NAD(P)-dependent dehydrogenase (short-subunit alcohol dehydrogenase family)